MKASQTNQRKLFAAIEKKKVSEAIHVIGSGIDVNFALPRHTGHGPITPLMLASVIGEVVMVEALLSAGANVDADTDDSGCTALYYGLKGEDRERILTVVDRLLNFGADPNHVTTTRHGTVFVAGIRSGAIAVVKRMLDAGAHVNATAGAENAPLKEAAHVGDIEIAAELIRRGADANFQSKNGWSVLMSAAECGSLEVTALLLQKGAKLDLTTTKGETALMLASARMADSFDEARGEKYLQVVKELVKAGANLNTKSAYGRTALDFAAHNSRSGHEHFEKLWFAKGANYLREVGAKRGDQVSGQ